MATTWVGPDGKRYVGKTVRLGLDLPAGEHIFTKIRDDGTQKQVKVVTTAAPIDESVEGAFNPHIPTILRPHTGQLITRSIEDNATQTVVDPTKRTKGAQVVTPDRSNPLHFFASDVDPNGTMSAQEIFAALRTPDADLADRSKWRFIWFDRPNHLYEFRRGFSDGWFDSCRIGVEYVNNDPTQAVINGSRYSKPTWVSPTTGEEFGSGKVCIAGFGATDPSIRFAVKSGELGQRVWPISVNRQSDPDLAHLLPEGVNQQTLYLTDLDLGNRYTDWKQHNLKVLRIWGIDDFAMVNVRFVAPDGEPDGDLGINGWSGVEFAFCNNITVIGCEFQGFARGWAGSPPGETAQLGFVRCGGTLHVADTIIDGRRADGTRYTASPFSTSLCNWDTTKKSHVSRLQTVGGTASMMTDWRTEGQIVYRDLDVKDCAGPGKNSEDSFVQSTSMARLEWCSFEVRSGFNNNPEPGKGQTMHATINAGNSAAQSGTYSSFHTFVNCVFKTRGAYDYARAGGDLALNPPPEIAPSTPTRPNSGFTPSISSMSSYQGRLSNGAIDGRNSLSPAKNWGIKVWADGAWQTLDTNNTFLYDAAGRPIYDPNNADTTLRSPKWKAFPHSLDTTGVALFS